MVMRWLAPVFCGALFGIGLALSGMTDTRVVLGFLDITGEWNPALIFVMGGALTVTIPAFMFVLRREAPLLGDRFWLPEKTDLDRPLVVGAALFGVGWGLYGYCPGPALASLSSLNSEPFVFVIAMAAGMVLRNLTAR